MNVDTMKLLEQKITNWYEIGVKTIPNLVAALAIFVIFYIAAKLIKKLTTKLLLRISDNKAVNNLLQTIVYIIILAVGIFTCLEVLNLEKAVTSLLAGAGVLGLALGFAFQEIASNFVSGFLIAVRQPYKVGDIVKTNEGFFGTVKHINLRVTTLRTFDGLEILIPNKDMFTEPLINFTKTPERRLELELGVSYGDDLEEVEKILQDLLQDEDERVRDKDAEVYYDEFGSSSINLRCFIWIKYPNNKAYLRTKHNIIKKIKDEFDKNNITIPFPIRTLDFGIKGGLGFNEIYKKEK